MRHRDRRRTFAVCCAAIATVAGWVDGAVTTDGTVGPARALPGPTFRVTPDLGQQRGGNLFHSFSRFDLARGETAEFTGPASVERVLARVTGGAPSSIDGTLRCTIDNADVYLMNPAGVVFGPNASLDVRGSFAVTTADYIKLADGVGRFDAAAPAASVLTSAPPAAFGFLGPQKPAAIRVDGAVDTQFGGVRPELTVAGRGHLVIVGGDVLLTTTQLRAEDGSIAVAAVASAGEADVGPLGGPAGAAVDVAGLAQLGDVELAQRSSLSGSGTAGGVAVRGRSLRVVGNSDISAFAGPGGAPGSVDIDVRGPFELLGAGSQISGGSGGGGVSVRAATASVADGARIFIQDLGGGVTGGISLDVAGAVEVRGASSEINLDASLGSTAGGINIRAGSLAVTDGGVISVRGGGGTTGGVDLSVSGPLVVRGDGSTISATEPGIDGGTTGGLTIRAESVTVADRGQILADGVADGLRLTADTTLSVRDSGGVFAHAGDPDFPAGGVSLAADAVSVAAGGEIAVRSNGGTVAGVTVDARSIDVDGGTIAARAELADGQLAEPDDDLASVGAVRLNADAVTLRNGGRVTAVNQIGTAEGIAVDAGTLLLDGTAPGGGSSGRFTGIFTVARGVAPGGDVTVRAGRLDVRGFADIGTGGVLEGTGGAVDVVADEVLAAPAPRVVLDGTLAGGGGGGGAPAGGALRLTEADGQRVGENLFVSFDRLLLAPYEVLTVEPPVGVRTIIARVTGPDPTVLEGGLSTAASGAELLMLNPRGVTVGGLMAGADGPLALTTADAVQFDDGGRFGVGAAGGASLPDRRAARLSFAEPGPAAVAVNGPVRVAGADHRVLLVGGEVALGRGADLLVPDGRVGLAAVASAGEVGLDPQGGPAVDLMGVPTPGAVRLADGARVTAGRPGGTAVAVRARTLSVTGGAVLQAAGQRADDGSGGEGGGPPGREVFARSGVQAPAARAAARSSSGRPAGAGDVDILLTDALDVQGEGSQVKADAAGGRAGDVVVRADSVTVADGGSILTNVDSGSEAGDVNLTLAGHLRIDGGEVLTLAIGEGMRAGSVNVTAASAELANRASLGPISVFGGATGDLSVHLSGALDAHGDRTTVGAVNSNSSFGGRTGGVRIRAGSAVVADGADIGVSNAGGAAGGIDVEVAGTLELAGGTVSLGVDSSGEEGFRASGIRAGGIRVRAAAVDVRDGGGISAAGGAREVGGVLVDAAGPVTVRDGGAISLTASGFPTGRRTGGPRGPLTVRAASVGVSSAGGIESAGLDGAGAGGLRLRADEVVVDGAGAADPTQVRVQGVLGRAGGADLTVGGRSGGRADAVTVRNGGQVTADSFVPSAAGGVAVAARDVRLESGGAVTANAFRGGAPGVVRVAARDLSLTGRSSIAANNFRRGSGGGSVSVAARNVTLDDGSAITATGGGGIAENIVVRVDADLTLPADADDPDDFTDDRADVFLVSRRTGTRVQLERDGFLREGATFDDTNTDVTDDVEQPAFGFLSSFVGADLPAGVGEFVLRIVPRSADAAVTLDGWSLTLGGREFRNDIVQTGGTIESVLPVGADPGFTGGRGGNVAVRAGRSLAVRGGASVATSTLGLDRGGAAVLSGGAVDVSGAGTFVGSTSAAPGDAGGVTVAAGRRLTLRDGAAVTVRSEQSRAGDVRLRGGRLVEIRGDGPAAGFGTRVTAEAPGGSGGDVSIAAGRLLRVDGALVTAQTGGNGGQITLGADGADRGSVGLFDGRVLRAASGLGTFDAVLDGRRVALGSPVVSLVDSQVNGLAGGRPVRVQLAAPLVLSTGTEILTDAAITFPPNDLAGDLALLRPAALTGRATLVQQCGAAPLAGMAELSTFQLGGRGGEPPLPGGPRADEPALGSGGD